MQAQRSNKEYCNSSCRARACERRKQEEPAFIEPAIRGIRGETPKTSDPQLQSPAIGDNVIPEIINELKSQLAEKQTVRGIYVKDRQEIEDALNQLTGNRKFIEAIGLMGSGAAIGYSIHKNTDDAAIGAGIGLIAATLFDNLSPTDDAAKQASIARLNEQLTEISAQIALLDKEITTLKLKIIREQNRTAKTIQKPESIGDSASITPVIDPSPERSESAKKNSIQIGSSLTKAPNQSEKIKTSEEVRDMNFKELDFQGKWETFLGHPSKGFSMVIHGQPGTGKSSFTLKFSDYLARNFGKVLYITAEEGFSKTMQNKLKMNESFHPDLHIADLRSVEEIIKEVKPGDYAFIVIDSYSKLNLDTIKWRNLLKLFQGSTVITICQATKDGKIRGSLEIVHDCDIAIEVSDKIARTTKNRFQATPREFKVFD